MELGANYFLLAIAIRKDFTARLGYIPYPGESLEAYLLWESWETEGGITWILSYIYIF